MVEEQTPDEIAEEARKVAAKGQEQAPDEPGRTPNPTTDEPELAHVDDSKRPSSPPRKAPK